MQIQSLLGPLQGMQSNQKKFAEHADRISRWGTENPSSNEPGIDLATELTGTMVARHGFEANLAVLKTEDEMLGTLIDTLA